MMNRKDKTILAIGAAAGGAFLILLPLAHPYPLSFLLKALPVASLILVSLGNFKGRERILVLLALVFCLAGDILLDLDREANFKPALVSFLTGHLFYALLFLTQREFSKKRLLPMILALAYLIVTALVLRDMDPDFYGPVYAYLAVIGAMWVSTFLMVDFSLTVNLGAMIFVFSDTVIAVNKFLRPIPHSTVFNIGLYFIAQFLIVIGLISRARNHTRSA